MSLSVDAQEHIDNIPWLGMNEQERIEATLFVGVISQFDKMAEYDHKNTSVYAENETDLGINLDEQEHT